MQKVISGSPLPRPLKDALLRVRSMTAGYMGDVLPGPFAPENREIMLHMMTDLMHAMKFMGMHIPEATTEAEHDMRIQEKGWRI